MTLGRRAQDDIRLHEVPRTYAVENASIWRPVAESEQIIQRFVRAFALKADQPDDVLDAR